MMASLLVGMRALPHQISSQEHLPKARCARPDQRPLAGKTSDYWPGLQQRAYTTLLSWDHHPIIGEAYPSLSPDLSRWHEDDQIIASTHAEG